MGRNYIKGVVKSGKRIMKFFFIKKKKGSYYCKECGLLNDNDFCIKCGKKLKEVVVV